MGELQISPSELRFRFELKKQSSTTLRLHNPTGAEVAFKVKTTSPKKYCVRPNTGVVAPRSTTEVQIIMQVQREVPADIHACRDKFLVQSAVRSDPSQEVSEIFVKGSKDISEAKLKVSYEQPPPPPSPIAEDAGGEGEAEMQTPAVDLRVAAASPGMTDGERTSLQVKVRELTAQLDQARSELVKVASASALEGSAKGSDAAAAVGFTLLHLIITAMLAFLLGRFT
mmetsp:Transcript_9913/g.34561  ORF Transcript_9913/g.34561 Transcript_9913/m.34561 type:complete len:227 (+) Transcript_9913:149-829(+)